MTTPILEVLSAVKTYKRPRNEPVHALADVSLAIPPTRTLGIVGESGSGKTTLTRLLLGLEEPTGGQVLFRGEDLRKLDESGRRSFSHSVSAVFQNPYSSLSPRRRIWDIITEQQAIDRKRTKIERRKRAGELLELVGLPEEAADRFPHQLSGGQRQRVAIARGISQSPDLIVLDEPLSALDVSVSAQIINLLLDLQNKLQVSYVFVAHDMHLVRHMCHEVVVLYKGRIVERGVTEDVLSAPQHKYTQSLVNASELKTLDTSDLPQFRGEAKFSGQ